MVLFGADTLQNTIYYVAYDPTDQDKILNRAGGESREHPFFTGPRLSLPVKIVIMPL